MNTTERIINLILKDKNIDSTFKGGLQGEQQNKKVNRT